MIGSVIYERIVDLYHLCSQGSHGDENPIPNEQPYQILWTPRYKNICSANANIGCWWLLKGLKFLMILQ